MQYESKNKREDQDMEAEADDGGGRECTAEDTRDRRWKKRSEFGKTTGSGGMGRRRAQDEREVPVASSKVRNRIGSSVCGI